MYRHHFTHNITVLLLSLLLKKLISMLLPVHACKRYGTKVCCGETINESEVTEDIGHGYIYWN